MIRRNWPTTCAVALAAVLFCKETVMAEGMIRVDLGAEDGRRDTGTPHWQTWKVAAGERGSGRDRPWVQALAVGAAGLDCYKGERAIRRTMR